MLKDARIIETPHGRITGEIIVTYTDDEGLPRNAPPIVDRELAAQLADTPADIPNAAHIALTEEIAALNAKLSETPPTVVNPDRAPIDKAVFAAAEKIVAAQASAAEGGDDE